MLTHRQPFAHHQQLQTQDGLPPLKRIKLEKAIEASQYYPPFSERVCDYPKFPSCAGESEQAITDNEENSIENGIFTLNTSQLKLTNEVWLPNIRTNKPSRKIT